MKFRYISVKQGTSIRNEEIRQAYKDFPLAEAAYRFLFENYCKRE